MPSPVRGTAHNAKLKDLQRKKHYGRRRRRLGKGSGGNGKTVSLNNNERNRMRILAELVAALLVGVSVFYAVLEIDRERRRRNAEPSLAERMT